MSKKDIVLKLDWKQQIALTGALYAVMAEDDLPIDNEDSYDFEAWQNYGRNEQYDRLGVEITDKDSNEDIGRTLNEIFVEVAKAFLKTDESEGVNNG
ncbi:hypothetical protein P4305_18955 [Bacillus thuringiensis]|nr:hypothetical protein [Bacillus thuringiensis]